MPAVRQLAAIMFTDMVGYTALMGEDELKAFDLLRQNRLLHKKLIAEYNGKWIKELGDGVLASFTNVTDAVNCACALIKGCEPVDGLRLRIGIHLGEVVFEDDDVFGDGVNIASRLQTLAPIDGIWISEPVYDNISNKKSIQAHFVKEETLKHVKEPIGIYEIDTQHSQFINGYSAASRPSSKNNKEKSIAVLPFINISNDPEQEYFSEGIAEEIINSLVHVKDLKVAGRMSSFQFKGAQADLREVGEKLGVQTVLEGSVRRQSNRLRVTAQLVNVEDGFQLWSERYDRTIDDIFAIQDEIALSITEKLKGTLLKKDQEQITKNYTQNTEAFELYLKGRFFLNRRGAYIFTGIPYFEKAMEIDPNYALAHVGYADAHLLLATYGLASPNIVMPKAKQAAERAVELEPSLAEPYCSLGFYYTAFEWNWAEGKKNFLHSLELNPHNAEAHSKYGWNYLTWIEGDFDEAEKHGEASIQIEPLSAICHGVYSVILHTAGKFDEAMAICKNGIELDANSFLCRVNEGNIYLSQHRYAEAIATFEPAITIFKRHPFIVNGLIWAYCLTGQTDKAHILMDELNYRSEKEYIPGTFTGLSAAYLHNIDKAIYYLEKAANDKDPILLTLQYEHWVPDTLKQDPRYQAIMERINFPKESV